MKEGSHTKNENKFQSELIRELRDIFPECEIMKNDPNFCQGFPDLSVFIGKKFAILECKKSQDAEHQPNQDYYISKFGKDTYASFIFPENKKEVIEDLKSFFS